MALLKIKRSDLEFGRELGAGGFGTVYQATLNQSLLEDQEVAVKRLNTAQQTREIEILPQLDHPNIIKLYGVVNERPDLFLVMELCEGGSVREYLNDFKGTRLPFEQFCDWVKQAALPIEYLKGMKIVHKDIKTPNYMIAKDGRTLKLGDFGLARKVTITISNATSTASYAWMAPELFTDNKLSLNYDIFSFGVVVWEFWTTEYPHKGLEPQVIAWRVCNDKERLLIPDDCPKPLAEFLRLCWQEDWKARPNIDHVLPMIEEVKAAVATDAVPNAEAEAVPKSVADEVPKAVADVVPKAVANAVPNAVADTVPKAVADAVPNAVADAVPNAVADAVPKSVADAVPKSVADEVPKSVADEVPKLVADAVPKSVADEVPKSVADEIPKSVADEVPKAVSDAVPKAVADAVPNAEADAVPQAVADAVPNAVADTVPKAVADAVPEAAADVVPNAVSDAVPKPVADAVPNAVADDVPKPVADAVPNGVADAVPKPVADAVPNAVADTVPKAVADAVPNAVADTVPKAVADAVPKAVADAVPKAVADAVPKAVADTVPKAKHILEGEWKLEQFIGEDGPGKLAQPSCIAVSSNTDTVAVADHNARQVQVYSAANMQHRFTLNTQAKCAKGWSIPTAVQVGRDDMYYVADTKQFVLMFAATGEYANKWAAISPQDIASDDENTSLQSLTMNMKGQILVGEVKKKYISKHQPGGSHIASIRVDIKPLSLAVTSHDTIVISNWRETVHIVDSEGQLLHEIKHLTRVDRMGLAGVTCFQDIICICNFDTKRIHCYSVSSEYLRDLPISLRGQPICLAFTPDGGHLWVAYDDTSYEVAVYKLH